MATTIVCKSITIAAAHHLPLYEGKCHDPHGHNYKIELFATGSITPTQDGNPKSGLVIDFEKMKVDLETIVGVFDHTDLNDNFENPTAEVLAREWLSRLIYIDPRYFRVRVHETDTCWAEASA